MTTGADVVVPPADVATTAAEALTLRARLGRGGTAGTVAIARQLADRVPISIDRARAIETRLAAARAQARTGWDLPSAPSNAFVRFMLLGGDPALRWLAGELATAQEPAKVAGLDTIPRRPEAPPAEVAEINSTLESCSSNLARIFETHMLRVAAWAEQTVTRLIRVAGAQTLDEVRSKARRAALGGYEPQTALEQQIAALAPAERLSAVPEPIRAAVEMSIEQRILNLIADTATAPLEAIFDAFHNRQIVEFSRLAQISVAEAGRLFQVSVPSSNAIRATTQQLVDLVLGRLDPGELAVGTVDAASGLVPGSISNDAILIAGGADIDGTDTIIRDAFGRALARDGGIADGGIGTFRGRLVDYGQRIAVRDSAVARITARLDIEAGTIGAPSPTERADLLAELRSLSERTPGRSGLGAGRIVGDAGKWVHGGAEPFPPHLALNGAEWLDLVGRERICASDGAWPYNPVYFPGDHLGCSCWIEPTLQMEVPA